MSRILWSYALAPLPDILAQPYVNQYYGNALRIFATKALSMVESEAPLPDRKAYRSMSRAGILLSLACLDAQPIIRPLLDQSPFSAGIYCAMENGTVDLKSTHELMNVSRDDFAEQYRKCRNPKMFLMQLPNLAPAQMGIFLGIMGPLNVYNSSTYGSIHALEQAEADLEDGNIECALVCSAFSFENPLVLERINRQKLNRRVLCEGAGALLLTRNDQKTNWRDCNYDETESYYGISHQLITQIQNRRMK